MNIIKNNLVPIVLAVLITIICAVLSFHLFAAVLIGIGIGSYYKVFKDILKLSKIRKTAVKSYSMNSQIILSYAGFGAGLVLFVYSIYYSRYVAANAEVLINMFIVILLTLTVSFNLSLAYVFITEEGIYISKLLKFDNIVRFNIEKNKKNKIVRIHIIYSENNEAKNIYIAYKPQIEQLLVEALPKKKKAY